MPEQGNINEFQISPHILKTKGSTPEKPVANRPFFTEADNFKTFILNSEVGSIEGTKPNDTYYINGAGDRFFAFSCTHDQVPDSFDQKIETAINQLPSIIEPDLAKQKMLDIYSLIKYKTSSKTHGLFGFVYTTPSGETRFTIANCGGSIFLSRESTHRIEDLTHRSHPGFLDGIDSPDYLPLVDISPKQGDILLITPNQIDSDTKLKIVKNIAQNRRRPLKYLSQETAKIARKQMIRLEDKTKDTTFIAISVKKSSNFSNETSTHKGYIVTPEKPENYIPYLPSEII